ncbi:pyroglutamyl-peptidase I [Clostridium algidicarnis]|uniref:pyroglutamyl-peptidase I n=1 Tax=Clostridium algidicarnis TaxID=37659 RepID=UPI00162AA6F4|nr:pyroglutamyl-peptidase I [Clostridium algidicarnis]MBB6698307.1 pyroglutamyl-peptidase I [Clostridium algidicarnis]MBU3193617.1 pyroglutamyl-peptidase I [Clostridium algidicarnis]MBU3197516.1 pyroglutamyl-peptidase I [Clostridium algidicarnis]MBU3204940.1 pyroglutamyl-peptidase I [Clostridium algidicarnis]MBU3213094.1 pyroglutamyl-peptidase I [Clostridium algidicarnis]
MKILVTGFDPFGGENINPALEAVKKISDNIDGVEIIKIEVPTVFKKSIDTLDKAIEAHKPDVVLCVGQAGGRFDITPEKVAINLDDARIKDNEGNNPIDEPIFKDGETAYFSSLPVKAIVKNIKENNIPSSVSYSAGTFVCNHIMYGLLYLIDKKYKNVKGGFIHVPFIPSQVLEKKNMPSMALEDITKGLEFALKAIIENKDDIKETGGKIS